MTKFMYYCIGYLWGKNEKKILDKIRNFIEKKKEKKKND